MIINTAEEMFNFGKSFSKKLSFPAVLELIGDVGVGKTTFTQGLATGLGVDESVTSPSFTISKRYAFPNGSLIHYDFYRLPDPGLMADDLLDSISEPNSVVVIEWGNDISNLLPQHQTLQFKLQDNGSREVTIL